MLRINVFLVGIKQKDVISTNLFAVDSMLRIMANYDDIWTLQLVSIQAFYL